MFCKNCGAQCKDESVFCTKCGQVLKPINPGMQVDNIPKTERRKKSKRRIWIGLLAGGILVVLLILYLTGGFEKGYERVVRKYVKAINDENGALLYSIYMPEYTDWLTGPGSFYSSSRALADDFTDECQDRREDLMGDLDSPREIKYTILMAEKAEDDEIDSLDDEMYYSYDSDRGTIKDAYKVTFAVYMEGGDAYLLENYIVKAHGKWYMIRGI